MRVQTIRCPICSREVEQFEGHVGQWYELAEPTTQSIPDVCLRRGVYVFLFRPKASGSEGSRLSVECPGLD